MQIMAKYSYSRKYGSAYYLFSRVETFWKMLQHCLIYADKNAGKIKSLKVLNNKFKDNWFEYKLSDKHLQS